MALGDIAANLPWPVFACADDKTPVVPTGFKAASRDTETILAQFKRSNASAIGVPTGAASGLVVIDVDIKAGARGMEWLNDNKDALPETRTHKTRSGGLHLLFRAPEGITIRNSASRVAPGIDVRGDGGYIIVPPSPGYVVADQTEPADMPRWLIRECMRQEPEPAPAYRPHEIHERYVQAAIDGEVLAVIRAGEGTRNDRLNVAAVKLGTLIAAGQMSRSTAEAELQRAGQQSGLDAKETTATIKSGIDFGLQHPRHIPEKTHLNGHAKPAPAAQPAPDPKKGHLWSIIEAWSEGEIPLRPWVARGYYMRRSVTVVSGPGSAGKSSLMVAHACAMGVGSAFSRMKTTTPLRVMTYNVEDDADEQKRRFSATLTKMGLSPKHLNGNVAILGPDKIGTLLTFGRDGAPFVNTAVMDELETFVSEFKPDVLILDPFVELHSAEENDNTAVRSVLARFRSMAIEHNMAVVILHHARKGAGTPGDPDSLRGASSIVGAARVALTLNVMTDEEAGLFNIPKEKRFNYFRLDRAKSNYAPIEDAEWFERHEVKLHNGSGDEEGDAVGVVWPFKPPSVWQTSSTASLNKILDVLATPPAGWLYSPTKRGGTTRWAGTVVMAELGCSEEQATKVIATWIKSGVLVVESYRDEAQRKDRDGVRVVNSRRPE